MKNKKHIVVVDDDKTNAALLEEFLKDSGYEVSVALTGADGRRLILEQKPDMVLLDLFLPDMKGSDLCERLRANTSTHDIPVILMTAHKVTHGEKMKGFRAGIDDYLIRPFELAELQARIEMVFRRATLQPKTEVLAGIEAILKKPPTERPEDYAGMEAPTPSSPAAPAPAVLSFSSPQKQTKPPRKIIHFIERFWGVLNHPVGALKASRRGEDFLTGFLMVLLTPLMASISKISQSAGGFDAWIGFVSLGLVVHCLLWVGLASLLHMVVPFQGVHLPMKRAFAVAGLTWAPRLLAALLGTAYSGVALAGWVPQTTGFSSGIDIVPGLAAASWARTAAVIGIFDVWAAWLAMTAVWMLGEMKGKKWSSVTILVGVLCLVFGAFAS